MRGITEMLAAKQNIIMSEVTNLRGKLKVRTGSRGI